MPDSIIHHWVQNLPQPDTVIVSLLGRKPDGRSEFSFYPFYGGFDTLAERGGRLSFQEWLNAHHGELGIEVREHPTHDFRPVPSATLEAISTNITELLAAGKTVVLIDSGGEMRTGQVCKHMSIVEDFS